MQSASSFVSVEMWNKALKSSGSTRSISIQFNSLLVGL